MSNFRRRLMMSFGKKTAAKKVYENPTEYYGKSITNYSANGVEDWKIFYSDGSNVYLITSEYIDPVKLPEKDGAKPDQGNAANYPKAARFNKILGKYSGTANITDEKMKAFNSDYFDNNYTSTYNNMKAVAYMLDKDIWSDFANRTVAEYAVGGPSVEMLLKSYCEKVPEKKDLYKTQASSATGYQVSNNGGTSYANGISGMLSTSDTLYVLPSAATSGADAMWLASPSAGNTDYVMNVYYNGYVYRDGYSRGIIGFRPLVCLNSDIQLEAYEGGYKIS